ncbi:MAG: methyl-accepting chemotaxis protein, partial [Pseudomonadota bacterium]
MSFNTHTVQFRLSMLLLIGTLLLGAAFLHGFLTLSQILNIYNAALHQEVAQQRQILNLESDFKKQVQEWKNVLLRGYAPKNLNKYWGKFESKEATIRKNGNKLIHQLQQPEAKQLLKRFLAAHDVMGQAYREGLAEFKAANFDPKIGDKAVKGIDREPTRLLGKAAEAIKQELENATMELKGNGEQAMLITTGLTLLSLFAMIALSVWLVRKIVIAPTQQISACLNKFATGDFSDSDIPQFSGELGSVLNHTQTVREHLGGIILNVRNAANNLTTASGELDSITQTTQHDLAQQQSDIQQVATAMDQMSVVVGQVSQNAEAAAGAAKKADQATIEGRSVVEQTINAIGGLAKDVEGASVVIQKLETDVANIGTVLDVIRGIAEQTNLLALNAAIEAARAGEQGRGFAVVADEVRTLAGRTQESTSEIQSMIEKLEQGATQAVSVMRESRQQADVSVEQAASTEQSFAVIAEAVVAIAEMNQQIAVSSTEQSAVTEEIHRKIVDMG